MKNINLRSVILIVSLLAIITTQSCKKEDQPTPVVYKAFTVPVLSTSPATKADGTVFVTGSTVDLMWVSETGGNADNWTVYVSSDAGDDTTYKGVTTQSFALPVEDGVHYTWHVEALDRNGVNTTSPEQSFTAVKGTNPEINIALTATTDVASAIGLDLSADEVIDLRILIVKSSDKKLITAVDVGYANEEYHAFDTLPDGEYLIGVDMISTINAGDFNEPITVSLSLQFDQLGLIDTKLDYPDVMTNENPCTIYRTYLATVTKVGAKYTITKTVSNWVSPDADPSVMAGVWSGFDADPSYPSEVVSAMVDDVLEFTGVGRAWMFNDWGEVITAEYPFTMEFNYCANTVIIPKQKVMSTTWKGDVQPDYYIFGEGTFDLSGEFPVMSIQYDFDQPGGGGTIARYFEIPYFTLEISLAPGKKAMNTRSKVSSFPVHPKR